MLFKQREAKIARQKFNMLEKNMFVGLNNQCKFVSLLKYQFEWIDYTLRLWDNVDFPTVKYINEFLRRSKHFCCYTYFTKIELSKRRLANFTLILLYDVLKVKNCQIHSMCMICLNESAKVDWLRLTFLSEKN